MSTASGASAARALERAEELGLLRGALAAARAGQRRAVVVTGPSGIGKTTLLDAFLAEVAAGAAGPEAWAARGGCVEHHGSGEPYLPLLDALGQLGRSEAAPELLAALRRFAPLWLQQLPGLLDAESQRELGERTRGASPARMLREITELLEVLSRERTVVLALEDLHWSDPSTCALLGSLSRRQQPARLLLVATLRNDEAPEHLESLLHDLHARAQVTEVQLGPLSESAVRQYVVARLAGSERRDELIQQLYERTQGHPLFLARLVDGLASGEAALPETLRGFAMSRLASLPAELRETVEVASVAGTDFSAAEIAACCRLDIEEAERRCSALSRRGQLVQPNGAASWPDGTLSGRYRFCHESLCEAIHDSLEEGRRARLHRLLAATLEQAWGERGFAISASLRCHFEAGHDLPSALRHAARAAQFSSSRNAPRETLQHLETALRLLGELDEDPARELELRIQLGPALRAVYGWRSVLDNYSRARRLALKLGHVEHLAAALRGLVSYHHGAGEHGQARVECEHLLALCAERSGAALVQAHQGQLVSAILAGDFLRALDHASRAVAAYRWSDRDEHASRFGGSDPAVSALAWSARVLCVVGFPDAALECAGLAVAAAEVAGDAQSSAFAEQTRAVVLGWLGRGEEAVERLEAARAHVQRESCELLSWLIEPPWIAATVGRREPARAAELVRALMGRAQAAGIGFDVPSVACMLADFELRAGQLASAEATLERASELCESAGLHLHRPALAWLRARHALASAPPRLDVAEEWLGKAIEAARQQHALGWELRAALLLASEPLARRSPRHVASLLAAYSAFDEGLGGDLALAERRLRELGVEPPPRARSARRGLVAQAWSVLRERGVELSRGARGGDDERPSEGSSPGRAPGAAEASEPGLTEASPAGAPGEERFVREGEFWTVQFEGRTCHVKDSRGIGLLAQLLSAPRREVHVLDLAADRAGSGEEQRASRALAALRDAGGIDQRARAAYQGRARELAAELELARADNDLGRQQAVQRELELLHRELGRAYGLSGRRRASGTPSERARVNVTRAIKSATQRIAGHHPALADHLARSVRTGTFCVYAPESARSWRIEGAS